MVDNFLGGCAAAYLSSHLLLTLDGCTVLWRELVHVWTCSTLRQGGDRHVEVLVLWRERAEGIKKLHVDLER